MNSHRFGWEMSAASAAYVFILIPSIIMLKHGIPHGSAAILVAMAPAIPAACMCWATLRQLRRMDEMQRRLHLEALAMAFAGTALITFSYGCLENVGYPHLTMFYIWPIMAALWIVGLAIGCRRYA